MDLETSPLPLLDGDSSSLPSDPTTIALAAALEEAVEQLSSSSLSSSSSLIQVHDGGRFFCHRCRFLSNGKSNGSSNRRHLSVTAAAASGSLIQSQGAQSLVALAYTLFEKNVAQVSEL